MSFTKLLILLPLLAADLVAQSNERYSRAPISYGEAGVEGPLERLLARLEGGGETLALDENFGYLPALLGALQIPASSQMLVFSKTSLQADRIGPRTPRAIYFGDDVYVGWVPGSKVLEISSMDPVQGPLFYTLTQPREGSAQIERGRGQCLACHGGSQTQGWPGNLVRSVQPDPQGRPLLKLGTRFVDHRTAFEDRWGGWYVSGTHGEQRHQGNAVVGPEQEEVDRSAGANLTDLAGHFDTELYLSPHSDLVALMLLEHQAEMHNILARASYEVRLAMARDIQYRKIFEEPTGGVRPGTKRLIDQHATRILDYLLFKAEAVLTEPIAGTSGFAAEFTAAGQRDSKQRSLKELDLQTRLLRYPCSYLIYSPAFDALPAPLLEVVYAELLTILQGAPAFDEHIRLSLPIRRAILEILLDTKPTLPEGWR